MFVTRLWLTDFRCYRSLEISLGAGVTVFAGSNGQGKTNLVEAVGYLATLASHRVAGDAPLIRQGAEQAVVRAGVQAGRDDPRTLLLEVAINTGRANRARINKVALPRVGELAGTLRTVLFAPEDQAIVKGDPADRRAFLDSLVISRWPRMAGVKADFERTLRQRNTLLKAMAGRSLHSAGGDADSTLSVWNDQLAATGADLTAARLDTLAALAPLAASAYAAIAPVRGDIELHYRASIPLPDVTDSPTDPDILRETILREIDRRRSEELARGVTLVGPHRDDVTLMIGGLPAKGYASHGESWSLALALRLGQFELLRADGIEPVLMLDDVFAELDAARRDRLAAAALEAEQVLVTAAVESDVPEALLAGATHHYRVADATVVEPVEEVCDAV